MNNMEKTKERKLCFQQEHKELEDRDKAKLEKLYGAIQIVSENHPTTPRTPPGHFKPQIQLSLEKTLPFRVLFE